MGVLEELLETKEPFFRHLVERLEIASGNEGRDARLVADIVQTTRRCLTKLELDPSDTTPQELFEALMARAQQDNQRLAGLLGGNGPDDTTTMRALLVTAVQGATSTQEAWVLKRATAKKLLQALPPKQLMKLLGYRSLASMLKHEPVDELYAALRFSEGEAWLAKHNALMKTVQPSDFEHRELTVLCLDEKFTEAAKEFIAKRQHLVVHVKEMGVVALAPTTQPLQKGFTLLQLAVMLHYVNEVRLYSTLFLLQQVRPQFGAEIARLLADDPSDFAALLDHPLHWRDVRHYFGKVDHEAMVYPELFEPHIQPGDLSWQGVEAALAGIDPQMAFWLGSEYVGSVHSGQVLSLNLMDVAWCYARGGTLEQFSSEHMKENLLRELFARYLESARLRNQVFSQL